MEYTSNEQATDENNHFQHNSYQGMKKIHLGNLKMELI